MKNSKSEKRIAAFHISVRNDEICIKYVSCSYFSIETQKIHKTFLFTTSSVVKLRHQNKILVSYNSN